MATIGDAVFYLIAFISVYVQVFFLLTFFINRKKILAPKAEIHLEDHPSVTIIVPCWNEEKTVYQTVLSLLNLEYPKDKLQIFLIDDGSTDSTWGELQKFSTHDNVQLFKKENGGKYTALNLGLGNAISDFIACLDADSFVAPDSLLHLVNVFKDPEVMAVVPAVVIYKPATLIQFAQKIEFQMLVYVRKMLGIMGALPVTPGTLPVYRREVFDKIGGFRHAHNTEDGEIALRMQANNMKIEYCPEAVVYNTAPSTISKLFRQRVRWTYGFFGNLLDYRHMIFKKEFGNLGFFTLPTAICSTLGVIYLFGRVLIKTFNFIENKIVYYQTVGFDFNFTNTFSWDLFYINTQSNFVMFILLTGLLITSMLIGRKIVDKKFSFSFHVITYCVVYSMVAPFWMVRSFYNLFRKKEISWR